VGFFACTAALFALVNVWAALITLPGWLIGYHHAPGSTCTRSPPASAIRQVSPSRSSADSTSSRRGWRPSSWRWPSSSLLVLSGIKVIDDSTDVEYDRSIDKRTVAVVLGRTGHGNWPTD